MSGLTDKRRPRPTAQDERPFDTSPAFTRVRLLQMDAAFCAAMRREIGRGTERARRPAPKPAPAGRVLRRVHPAPRHSGASSAAELCAEIGEKGGLW